jgi:hypothetical protein
MPPWWNASGGKGIEQTTLYLPPGTRAYGALEQRVPTIGLPTDIDPTSPRRASSATASGLPDAALTSAGQGGGGDLPVPGQKAYTHARVYDDAGSPGISRLRCPARGLLRDGEHRHPGVGLRRSMAGLRAPLSTLHAKPRGPPCMTRGQCGSLHLHCRGLPPPTSCRSPGARVHPIKAFSVSSVRERMRQAPSNRSVMPSKAAGVAPPYNKLARKNPNAFTVERAADAYLALLLDPRRAPPP